AGPTPFVAARPPGGTSRRPRGRAVGPGVRAAKWVLQPRRRRAARRGRRVWPGGCGAPRPGLAHPRGCGARPRRGGARRGHGVRGAAPDRAQARLDRPPRGAGVAAGRGARGRVGPARRALRAGLLRAGAPGSRLLPGAPPRFQPIRPSDLVM
ncbi:MAG: hypothetical protein AVDCRST_MAG40-1156, partial [uncultured Gemmatimonadaceae bacterium]